MNTSSIELPNEAFILPNDIPMWPPTWGFWFTLGTLLCTVLVIVWFIRRRYASRRYRREALTLLANISDATPDSEVLKLSLQAIRRTLMTEQKEHLASLPTEALLHRLDQQSKSNKYAFSTIAPDLAHGLYRPNATLSTKQRQRIVRITCYWIRKHNA